MLNLFEEKDELCKMTEENLTLGKADAEASLAWIVIIGVAIVASILSSP